MTHTAPLLSLCMIVRDSSATLPACLASIRPWVDELVIVDTGSVDDTRNIARGFDAALFEFPWIDDFSAARNESLRHARGQWLFWMDSDDTINAENGRLLRELAHGTHSEKMLGYVVQVHCPSPSDNGGEEVTAVDHVKLIRNHPEIRFEGRIHEQILPSIRRLSGEVGWTDLFVIHSGADHSPEAKQRKYERDLRILKLDVAERPDHPFVLFNLGMTYDDMGQHQEAESWLQKCLAVSSSDESHVRKAYALLASSIDRQGRPQEAHDVCRRALEVFPGDEELLFRLGILEHGARNIEAAIRAFRQVLAANGPRHFTSIDHGVLGYKARHNLALVYEDAGRLDLAELQWRCILADLSTYRPATRSLARLLTAQGRANSLAVFEESLRDSDLPASREGLHRRQESQVPTASVSCVPSNESSGAADPVQDDRQGWSIEDRRARPLSRFELGPLATLPECHSRRDHLPAEGIFFCAHPQVHTRDNLVTPGICRVCPHADEPAPVHFRARTVSRRFEWISLAKLAAATRELAGQMPPSIAGVVGIARSGMIPASILAAILQSPLFELAKDGSIRPLNHGCRGHVLGWAGDRSGPLVVVDDTVYGGNTMSQARHATASIRDRLIYAAVFVRPDRSQLVDLFARLLPSPHLLEWNFFNSGVLIGNSIDPALWGGTALDFDGILCHDPSVPDADDEPGLEPYAAWLRSAKPRWLPRRVPAKCIITARLERWRSQTEEWLNRHGVAWQKLIMHPAERASDRNSSDVAAWKAEALTSSGCRWYVESDRRQAERIGKLSGQPVICPDAEVVFH